MDPVEADLFARGVRQAAEAHRGRAFDAALEEIGWHDALVADPRLAVSTLFEAQGATGSTSAALDDLLIAALGLSEKPRRSLVLPGLDDWDPPADLEGERVTVHGLATARLGDADSAVVVATTKQGTSAIVVKTADFEVRSIGGVDPELGLTEVVTTALDGGSQRALPSDAWPDAVGLGQLALAHELVGAGQAMLDLARTHALDRIQFGRPVGTFQAIRHRLAESYVGIEGARALLAEAWDEGSPRTRAMAKAVAGQAARTAARHCQQVLAGIGFTTEHPFERYVRRILVLDELLGSSRSLARALGRELIDRRELPRPLAL